MTDNELKSILNKISTLFRNSLDVSSPQRLEIYLSTYRNAIGGFEYIDVNNALDTYVQMNETIYAPTINKLIHLSKSEKHKREHNTGCGNRRIVTPEELMAKEYKELMLINPKTEEIVKRCNKLKKYYDLFNNVGWEERYKEYFNTKKTREEYEKL